VFWYTWLLIYDGLTECWHDTEFNNAELQRSEVRRRRGPYNRDNQRRRAVISPRLRSTLLHGRTEPVLLERNVQSVALSVLEIEREPRIVLYPADRICLAVGTRATRVESLSGRTSVGSKHEAERKKGNPFLKRHVNRRTLLKGEMTMANERVSYVLDCDISLSLSISFSLSLSLSLAFLSVYS